MLCYHQMASEDRIKFMLSDEELQEVGFGTVAPPANTQALVDKYKSTPDYQAMTKTGLTATPHT